MARFGPLEAHEVTDSTDFLQSLLDSAEGEITIPKGNAPWFTRPLFLRAEGKRIIFEEGCEIAALPGAFTGRGECVITSYSIHYTKLYDARNMKNWVRFREIWVMKSSLPEGYRYRRR